MKLTDFLNIISKKYEFIDLLPVLIIIVNFTRERTSMSM